jgi:hypothetical protein
MLGETVRNLRDTENEDKIEEEFYERDPLIVGGHDRGLPRRAHGQGRTLSHRLTPMVQYV